ncbi:hypothetical protein BZA77DRAFT_388216 [Pyronema omphalodes]|nr:hypothetical protein BZA77DRAFT_388216 [Pyronema omphalodes]
MRTTVVPRNPSGLCEAAVPARMQPSSKRFITGDPSAIPEDAFPAVIPPAQHPAVAAEVAEAAEAAALAPVAPAAATESISVATAAAASASAIKPKAPFPPRVGGKIAPLKGLDLEENRVRPRGRRKRRGGGVIEQEREP